MTTHFLMGLLEAQLAIHCDSVHPQGSGLEGRELSFFFLICGPKLSQNILARAILILGGKGVCSIQDILSWKARGSNLQK